MKDKNLTIYVDFDGTLADDSKAKYPAIGPPVPAMLARVKAWLAAGRKVKIFTARLDQPTVEAERRHAELVQNWCHAYGVVDSNGNAPPVTNRKGADCGEIWDDRAISVRRNTGFPLDANESRETVDRRYGIAAGAGGEALYNTGSFRDGGSSFLQPGVGPYPWQYSPSVPHNYYPCKCKDCATLAR